MLDNDLVREWLTATLRQISYSTSLTQDSGKNYGLNVEKVESGMCNVLIDAFKETLGSTSYEVTYQHVKMDSLPGRGLFRVSVCFAEEEHVEGFVDFFRINEQSFNKTLVEKLKKHEIARCMELGCAESPDEMVRELFQSVKNAETVEVLLSKRQDLDARLCSNSTGDGRLFGGGKRRRRIGPQGSAASDEGGAVEEAEWRKDPINIALMAAAENAAALQNAEKEKAMAAEPVPHVALGYGWSHNI